MEAIWILGLLDTRVFSGNMQIFSVKVRALLNQQRTKYIIRAQCTFMFNLTLLGIILNEDDMLLGRLVVDNSYDMLTKLVSGVKFQHYRDLTNMLCV